MRPRSQTACIDMDVNGVDLVSLCWQYRPAGPSHCMGLHGKKLHPLLTQECRLGTGEVCKACMGCSPWVLSLTSQCCLALANCPRAPGTSWLLRGCHDLRLVLDWLLLRQDQCGLSPALGTWQEVQGHWPGGPHCRGWGTGGRAFLGSAARKLLCRWAAAHSPCTRCSSSLVTRSHHVYLIEPASCLDGGEPPSLALYTGAGFIWLLLMTADSVLG